LPQEDLAREEYAHDARRWAASDNVLDLSELRRSRALEVEREVERELERETKTRRAKPRAEESKPSVKASAAPKAACAPCHWGLIVSTLLMALLSVPAVYSASQANALNFHGNVNYFLTRQLGFVGVGICLLIGASRLSSRSLRGAMWVLYGVSLLGLLAIEFTPLGLTMGSTQRWLRLGPIQLQVSELAKIALIGVLADFWSRAAVHARGEKWPWLAAFGIAAPVVALVFKEPHLSAALVLFSIPLIIGFYAGAPLKHFATMLGGLAAVAVVFVGLNALHAMPSLPIYKYQQERLAHFLSKKDKNDDRGAHYQTAQGLRAIERGGYFGVGPGASLYKQGHLPAPHTDFILAIIGEETGLVGMLFLLACYGAIIFFCFQIGHVSGQTFEALLCAGVGSLLALQVLCNMSVVLNILPVTGMPLPMISYGGSGLLCCMLALGFVLGVSRQSGQEEKE
jgi:cell division protein FtsW